MSFCCCHGNGSDGRHVCTKYHGHTQATMLEIVTTSGWGKEAWSGCGFAKIARIRVQPLDYLAVPFFLHLDGRYTDFEKPAGHAHIC